VSEFDDLRDRLTALLERCEEIVVTTERQGPQLVSDNVRRNVDAFALNPIAQQQLVTVISGILDKVVAQTRRVLALQKSMADSLGHPDRLREAAAGISERVTAASTDLASRVHRSSLVAIDNADAWNGPGSDGYANILSGQDDAVRQVAVVSAEIEVLLTQLADNIELYYSTLYRTVGGLYGALLGVAGAVATGPTGVGPLRGIAASIASLIDSIVSLVEDMMEKNGAIEQRLRELGSDSLDWPNRAG